MKTLRTPKNWMGPSIGIPSLTFQSWYEARFGKFAWELLTKIPTHLWMEYLCWFKKVLKLPTQNDAQLLKIIPEKNHFKLVLSNQTVLTEKVVLATGLSGFGGGEIPDFMQSIPKSRWAHTNGGGKGQIDFDALKGKQIAIIGGGDAGFDAAATALEHGAASVDLHIRRKTLPKIDLMHGFFANHAEYHMLSDQEKFNIFSYVYDQGLPPPFESILRAEKFPNFYFHSECDLGKIPSGFDFYILATGPCNQRL